MEGAAPRPGAERPFPVNLRYPGGCLGLPRLLRRPVRISAGERGQPSDPKPRESWSSHPGSVLKSLVGLRPGPRQLIKTDADSNERVLVSAAAVCFLTHVLTLQGLMLAGYIAAASAVPLGAMNHAIKKRKIWPAVCVLLPLLIVPNVSTLRALYVSLINPVSVQIKARVTLPAVVHAAVGSKHPLLRASVQYAKVGSQVVLLIALLQYLFAPKVAEAMRQRAIMLCRAFTSTESQGMSMQGGESRLETWPNKETGGEHKRFLGEILRGDPRKLSSLEDAERLAKLRRAALRRLPRGQQPSIAEAFEHADEVFSFVESAAGELKREVGATRAAASDRQTDNASSGHGTASEEDVLQQAAVLGGEEDLDLGDMPTPEHLLEALDEQLDLVRQLANEVRSGSAALQESEEAREGLAKELEATLGEKHQLGQELAALALKFEAAQSLWERQGASLAGLVTEEVLESIVQTLSERREQGDAEELFSIVDGDALAAKFQVPHNEAGPLIQDLLRAQNNVQPFGKVPSDAAAKKE